MNTILLALISTAVAQAAATELGYRIGTQTCTAHECVVSIAVDQGLHFNLKAPFKVNGALIETKASDKFVLKLDPATTNAKLALFVCDAGETYCAQRMGDLDKTSANVFELKQTQDQSAKGAGPKTELAKAFRESRASRRLVLADFSAVWCPACLRLDEEVLKSIAFAATAKQFVMARVDSDAPGTDELKQRYVISDMPTLLVLDGSGEELARFHGFRTEAQLEAELKSVLLKKPPTLSELRKEADAGDRGARDKVGVAEFGALQMANAHKYLEGTKNERERLLLSEVELAGGDKDKSAKALRSLLIEFPNMIDAPRWALRLGEVTGDHDSDAKAIALADKWIGDPKGLKSEFSFDPSRDDVEVGSYEMKAIRAEALERIGKKDESKKAWADAVSDLKANVRSSGQALILLHYFKRAGQLDEIGPALENDAEKFPDLYIFNFDLADRYFKDGNLARAASEARLAYRKSVGMNRVKSALLLSKILKQQKKDQEAVKVATETLNGISVSDYQGKYNLETIQKLKDETQSKAESSKP